MADSIYDKVNRSELLRNSEKVLSKDTTNMLRTCLQTLTVTTKGDILGKEARLRLGLTQGAPLSPILFLLHINDLPQFCPKPTDVGVVL